MTQEIPESIQKWFSLQQIGDLAILVSKYYAQLVASEIRPEVATKLASEFQFYMLQLTVGGRQ